jgi:hypothetical protein
MPHTGTILTRVVDRGMDNLALIQPGSYTDPDSGESITVSVSSRYSKIRIAKRDWYFIRESGAFDGTSLELVERGPILVSDSSMRKMPASDHPFAGRRK